MLPEKPDMNQLHAVIDRHRGEKWGLIPLLQEIQATFGYIPPEAIPAVAQALHLFPSQVQGVISFYAGFTLTPRGKYVVRVCRGTACHVKGGNSILRHMKKELELEEGETDPDYRFTLETVACMGACFLAPTMMVNQTYYGRLSPSTASSVVDQFKKT